jgi:hypothetical protein
MIKEAARSRPEQYERQTPPKVKRHSEAGHELRKPHDKLANFFAEAFLDGEAVIVQTRRNFSSHSGVKIGHILR